MFIFFYHLQYVVKKIIFFFLKIQSSFVELNTLTILPSLLACACIKAAIKGLSLRNTHQIDLKIIHCDKTELVHIQYIIEQLFQSCLQDIPPSATRRCLAPIDTSPQQRTKVK
jgi:hypothetical protein